MLLGCWSDTLALAALDRWHLSLGTMTHCRRRWMTP